MDGFTRQTCRSAPAPTSGAPDFHWPPPLSRVASPRMNPDATYKHILSHAVMVEELMRWLVAERHGMHALVDALDFSTLTRMHEQSVSAAGVALRRFGNDMVWQVHLREGGEDEAGATAIGRADRAAAPPGGDDAEHDASGPGLSLVVMLERRTKQRSCYLPAVDFDISISQSRIPSARTPPNGPEGPSRVGCRAERRASAVPWTGSGRRGRRSTAALLTELNIEVDDMVDAVEQAELLEALREAMRTREEFRGLSEDDRLDMEEMVLREAMRRVEEMHSLRESMFRWAGWKAKEMGLKVEPEELVELSRTGSPDDIDAFIATRIQMWKEECQPKAASRDGENTCADGRQ